MALAWRNSFCLTKSESAATQAAAAAARGPSHGRPGQLRPTCTVLAGGRTGPGPEAWQRASVTVTVILRP